MMNNQPTGNAVKKAKKSLFKAQVRTVIILLAAVLVLGAVCGAVMYILRTDIDTYYETGHDGSGGTVTHTYYSRVNPAGGYMLVNEDGSEIQSFKYGESTCYETKLGTWLTLTGSGMISIYAQVEGDIMVDSENGQDAGSKSGVRTLLFAMLTRSEISSIEVFNQEGGYTLKSVVEGNQQAFYIDGYKNVTLDSVVFAGIVARCGRPLATKLNAEQMRAEDASHANDEGYTPIFNADGSINYSVYGLDETYEVTDKETGETKTLTTPYYVIEDTKGNTHKVILGNMVPDGSGYYIRYMGGHDAASNTEKGPREAVYTIIREYATETGYTTAVESTILAPAIDIVQPKIVHTLTATQHFDVTDFTVSVFRGFDGDGNKMYEDLVCFTYDDLEKRLNTVRQDLVYHFENSEALGLTGYEPDTDRIFDVLAALADISAVASDSESPGSISPAAPYVNTVALISPKFNISTFDPSDPNMDPEVAESAIKLMEYGLFLDSSAEFMISYESDVSGYDEPVIQTLLISKKTENDSYYVYAPMFGQVVEIGAQYLFFLEWDSFDWVDRMFLHTFVSFNDYIRVSAGDFDALFNVYKTYNVSTKQFFSDSSQSFYTTDIGLDAYGALSVKLSLQIPYTVRYSDGTTGTEKLNSGDLVSLKLSTVENYCRDQLGLAMLPGADPVAVSNYARNVSKCTVTGGRVDVLHEITVKGDDYGYLAPSQYLLTFSYENGRLTMKIRPVGKSTERVLYDSQDFALYFNKYVNDGGEPIALTDEQASAAEAVFKTVNRVTTNEYKATVSLNGGAETEIPVDAFKDLYEKLIIASFYGRADEVKAGGGTPLSKEEMDAYIAKGDDCDLRIEIGITVGTDMVYRIHDYTGLRSFVSLNGSGAFYINRLTKNGLIEAAKTVAEGKRVFE